MNRDLVEVLVALALIATSAGFAISGSAPAREPRTQSKRPRRERRRAAPELSGAAPVLEAAVSTVAVASTRPRIFTGEPTEPEPGRPATKRALKLLGGLTVLAAAGALGLLALVRAMVSLFERIGG